MLEINHFPYGWLLLEDDLEDNLLAISHECWKILIFHMVIFFYL